MLQPDERALLIDALRPPAGMRLDYAAGTTFSLDLEALLIAPVTFALFDARVAEGEGGTDPRSILEAVRRHAANIDLFCQGRSDSRAQGVPADHRLSGTIGSCLHRETTPPALPSQSLGAAVPVRRRRGVPAAGVEPKPHVLSLLGHGGPS